MELKVWQQRMLFGIVVAGLAVLGIYLVGSNLHGSSGSGAAATPSPTPSPSDQAAATAAPTPVAVSTPSSVNIYAWLPFTQAELTDAAGIVTSFCNAYDTYRYTDSASVYVGRMNGLITSSLAGLLRADYQTPGVASLRQRQRQVASGSGTIDSINAFGASSITFIVTLDQHLVSTQGTTSNSGQYSITVESVGSAWEVNNIQLASAGNS
jgi:hypothetical protein